MCGISGLVSWQGMPDTAIVRKMTDVLAHRGPDGSGIHTLGQATFGHRRLAIRDLSDAGHQPMLDPTDSIMVTFNGEIYNDASLRAEIEAQSDYRFRTRCDTEVLPIGWKLWGPDLFDRLEGMFAIAIWDRANDQLVLARDPVGIKPLYYALAGDTVLFSSELKGILASERISSAIDPSSFHTYLAAGYCDVGKSLVANVNQVTPGSYSIFTPTTVTSSVYWQPRRTGTITDQTEARNELHERLGAACTNLLISDVPVGLMLSSGIDSGILSTLLAGQKVPAFTARFASSSFDEGTGAQDLARLGGHDWHAIFVDEQTDIIKDFKAVALAVDGELADSSALAHFMICRALRKQVTVALAGDGADEFFGGYDTYLATTLAERLGGPLTRLPASIIGTLASRAGAGHEGRTGPLQFLSRFAAGLSAPEAGYHAEWRRLTPRQMLSDLYGPALAPMLAYDPLAEYRNAYKTASGGPLDKALLADQTYYLPADMLTKVDRVSMAHGLEIRVPFLERPVMELAGHIAPKLLVANEKKAVLRNLARALNIPSELVTQKKLGFNVPVAQLLRTRLRSLATSYFETNADIFYPLLKPDSVRAAWRSHDARKFDHGYLLWALLVHGVWREATS